MKKSNSCNLRIFLPLLFLLGFSSKLFAINPGRDYYLSPDSLGLQYQEVRLNTSDNLSLNCWDISTDSLKNKNTSIVIAYGDSGNMGSNLFLAKTLSNEGYKVILFDYRGFGKSDDFVIQKDMLYYNEFCEDLKTVLNYAKKDILSIKPVFLVYLWAPPLQYKLYKKRNRFSDWRWRNL